MATVADSSVERDIFNLGLEMLKRATEYTPGTGVLGSYNGLPHVSIAGHYSRRIPEELLRPFASSALRALGVAAGSEILFFAEDAHYEGRLQPQFVPAIVSLVVEHAPNEDSYETAHEIFELQDETYQAASTPSLRGSGDGEQVAMNPEALSAMHQLFGAALAVIAVGQHARVA